MPIDSDQLRTIVIKAVADAAEIAPESLGEDVNLFSLGLDSLNLANILIEIEDGVGAEVPSEVLDRFLEVGDVVTIKEVLRLLSTWEPDPAAAGPYDEVVIVRHP